MSTSTTTLFHSPRYRDAQAALGYLAAGLGFEPAGVYRDPEDAAVIHHAQMRWAGGSGGIMFGTTTDEARIGCSSAYLVVGEDADVDRVHAQALAHGFTEVRPPADMDYGGRGSTLADPEGNEWSLGSYRGE